MTAAVLERWYREHAHVVVRRGRALLGSTADGYDLLQDVFAQLVARPEQVTDVQQPVAWLYTLATRRALSRLRTRAVARRHLAEVVINTQAEGPADALALADLLAQLPEDELAAIVHFYLDELSHDEIAVALDCSRRHVGNLLQRARVALRAVWHAGDVLEEEL